MRALAVALLCTALVFNAAGCVPIGVRSTTLPYAAAETASSAAAPVR